MTISSWSFILAGSIIIMKQKVTS